MKNSNSIESVISNSYEYHGSGPQRSFAIDPWGWCKSFSWKMLSTHEYLRSLWEIGTLVINYRSIRLPKSLEIIFSIQRDTVNHFVKIQVPTHSVEFSFSSSPRLVILMLHEWLFPAALTALCGKITLLLNALFSSFGPNDTFQALRDQIKYHFWLELPKTGLKKMLCKSGSNSHLSSTAVVLHHR